MNKSRKTTKKASEAKDGSKDSVVAQTEMEGTLKEAFLELQKTGAPGAALLRQGIVRLAKEYREQGSVTFWDLEPASA